MTAGGICEKCWSDAAVVAKGSGRSQGIEYWWLLTQRKYDPCTPEQRTGIPAEPEPVLVETELSEVARKMLDFERQWWRLPGSKDRAIITTFAVRSTQYYQLLNALVDNALALAYAPDVVNRLARVRSAKRWRMA